MGYHGDDGRKFSADGRGEAYGPTFTTGEQAERGRAEARGALTRRARPPGDVVGAGIVLSRGEVFFTCAPQRCSLCAFRHLCEF